MWGDDADEFGAKGTSWINIRPGVAVQIEYSQIEYSQSEYDGARGDDEVDAKLTGQVRITRDQIFAADFLTDAMTGEEKG